MQVCDSVCRELHKSRHEFVVILPSVMNNTREAIERCSNLQVVTYDLRVRLSTILFGRDRYLDGIVKEKRVDAVLTLFGPSVWIPKCPHVCGFARAQLIIPESPYYIRMGMMALLKNRVVYSIKEWAFKRCSSVFYTEAPYSTERLKNKWNGKKVYTVTNFYNQVFDEPGKWKEKKIPLFDGVTFLTISSPSPHKNLGIAAEVAKLLHVSHPEFKFRFVFTFDRNQYDGKIEMVENCFEFVGSVDVSECPSLYRQSDIVFQPTLLECFTASYPEAMRMERPIITTDLEFAHGLCGDAAYYYSAVDANACAEALYKVATDEPLKNKLVENGKKRITLFDNYEKRAEKLISLLEKVTAKFLEIEHTE